VFLNLAISLYLLIPFHAIAQHSHRRTRGQHNTRRVLQRGGDLGRDLPAPPQVSLPRLLRP
jgi:hypothetical protein